MTDGNLPVATPHEVLRGKHEGYIMFDVWLPTSPGYRRYVVARDAEDAIQQARDREAYWAMMTAGLRKETT